MRGRRVRSLNPGGSSAGDDGGGRPTTTIAEQPLAQRVYEELRARILAGELTPGTKLRSAGIASELRVSRTPIREAFRTLEAEGLVDSIPNAGFSVAIPGDLEEVFAIQQRLEGLAASLAAERITVPELEELRQVQSQMQDALVADSVARFAELNGLFHVMVVRAARSTRLARMLEQLFAYPRSSNVIRHYTKKELTASAAEHRAILDGLWRRDARAVDELAQRHSRRSLPVLRRLGAHLMREAASESIGNPTPVAERKKGVEGSRRTANASDPRKRPQRDKR